LLQRLVILTQLVEAGSLDEHAGVGTRETGDREESDDGHGYKAVCVMQRDRHLFKCAVFVSAYEQDVEPFLLRNQARPSSVLS